MFRQKQKQIRRSFRGAPQLLLLLAVSGALMLLPAIPALAGQWKKGAEDDLFWYDHQDGTWAVGWELIDSDGDGMGEWYFFDEDGWLLTEDVTDDGYEVNEDGVWIVDETVVRVPMHGGGAAGPAAAEQAAGASDVADGNAPGSGSSDDSYRSATGNGGSGAASAADAAYASDVPPGRYRLAGFLYPDGAQGPASKERTWYLKCWPDGAGLVAEFTSVSEKRGGTMHYESYERRGEDRFVFREEESGLTSTLQWNREEDTVRISDPDLTRLYVRDGDR